MKPAILYVAHSGLITASFKFGTIYFIIFLGMILFGGVIQWFLMKKIEKKPKLKYAFFVLIALELVVFEVSFQNILNAAGVSTIEEMPLEMATNAMGTLMMYWTAIASFVGALIAVLIRHLRDKMQGGAPEESSGSGKARKARKAGKTADAKAAKAESTGKKKP